MQKAVRDELDLAQAKAEAEVAQRCEATRAAAREDLGTSQERAGAVPVELERGRGLHSKGGRALSFGDAGQSAHTLHIWLARRVKNAWKEEAVSYWISWLPEQDSNLRPFD
jgi:hypothetical protein